MFNHWQKLAVVSTLVASTGLVGCEQVQNAARSLGVGGSTAVGGVGGGLAGAGIGGLAGGRKGALIGALAGAAVGATVAYFYAKDVKRRQSTDEEKREGEEVYRERLAQTPAPQQQELKSSTIEQKKSVAVRLKDGSYQQIDPGTGMATDNSYIVTPEEEKQILDAQSHGQLVKVQDYDVVFDAGV